jgi:truncated hemoglobin YjbI
MPTQYRVVDVTAKEPGRPHSPVTAQHIEQELNKQERDHVILCMHLAAQRR